MRWGELERPGAEVHISLITLFEHLWERRCTTTAYISSSTFGESDRRCSTIAYAIDNVSRESWGDFEILPLCINNCNRHPGGVREVQGVTIAYATDKADRRVKGRYPHRAHKRHDHNQNTSENTLSPEH